MAVSYIGQQKNALFSWVCSHCILDPFSSALLFTSSSDCIINFWTKHACWSIYGCISRHSAACIFLVVDLLAYILQSSRNTSLFKELGWSNICFIKSPTSSRHPAQPGINIDVRNEAGNDSDVRSEARKELVGFQLSVLIGIVPIASLNSVTKMYESMLHDSDSANTRLACDSPTRERLGKDLWKTRQDSACHFPSKNKPKKIKQILEKFESLGWVLVFSIDSTRIASTCESSRSRASLVWITSKSYHPKTYIH